MRERLFIAAVSATAVVSAGSLPTPAAQAAPTPGTVCGSVTAANGTSQPVIVQAGTVNCGDAVATARSYNANIAKSQGNGAHLDVGQWHCATAVLADRPMSDSYTRCTAGTSSFQIGR